MVFNATFNNISVNPNKYIPKYNLIEEKFKHGKQGLYFKVYVLADYNNK
jgi:hypothetical protein